MATATLTNRNAHDAEAPEIQDLPPFWSSLSAATPANDEQQLELAIEQPSAKPSSALVGGLWIQIR